MIVNFLLSPPGLLQINNVSSFFPAWFANVYTSLYSTPHPSSNVETSSLIKQNSTESSDTNSDQQPLEHPDFGPFPTSLADLSVNRIHLNRILGLSNLYYIDPDDSEITQELIEARTLFAKLILSADSTTLQIFGVLILVNVTGPWFVRVFKMRVLHLKMSYQIKFC